MPPSNNAPDHIVGFRVSCVQGCFAPRWMTPDQRPDQRQGSAITLRATLSARRCKRCGGVVSVEAIWGDAQGRLPAGAPIDVPGRRQKA